MQSKMDDKDRLIKQQQVKLEELEKEKIKSMDANAIAQDSKNNNVETVNCATQTERVCTYLCIQFEIHVFSKTLKFH